MFVLAQTGVFTVHPILSEGTHPVSAVWTVESWLTQAASVDVVATGTIGTVTHTLAVLTVSARRTLLVAPDNSS